ncbi:cytochrome P450 2J6 [Folsomia candida]|uniref:cytochrome P450 2J6 n=1 Tax=Folsomia candida TaxID=158441 RepID=UPI0016052CA6|nr:cytochrome P450 2J6 [Folsomia candida]
MFVELIVLISIVSVIWSLLNSRFMKNYPPGPSPIFPLIGNIPQLIAYNKGTMIESFAALKLDYGPLIFIKLGNVTQLLIQDLELSKECLSSDNWIDRPFDELIGDRSFGKSLGIIFSSGNNWREMRRFTTRTLRDFGFGKNKSMESVIDEEISLLFTKMDHAANSGEALPMRQFFTVSILNILWSMVAGVRFAHDDGRLKTLIQLLDETTKNSPVETNIAQMFPVLWNVIKHTPKMKSRSVFHTRLQAFFRELIQERRESRNPNEEPKDFIDVFLKEIEQQKDAGVEASYFNEEQFIVTLYDLFVAGAETTSNTLEFGMLYMLLNPIEQQGVREEIHRVVGKSRRPTMADRQQLPYTEATLLEIQRMASVVPVLVRSANEDTTLSGYNVPKGTVAGLNLFGIHHSQKTWRDPLNFRPSRFLAGRQLINTNKLLPFGLGKRLCLGEPLAKASLFSYFATIMQQYIIMPANGTPSTQPVNGFTLSPRPYSIHLEKIT